MRVVFCLKVFYELGLADLLCGFDNIAYSKLFTIFASSRNIFQNHVFSPILRLFPLRTCDSFKYIDVINLNMKCLFNDL